MLILFNSLIIRGWPSLFPLSVCCTVPSPPATALSNLGSFYSAHISVEHTQPLDQNFTTFSGLTTGGSDLVPSEIRNVAWSPKHRETLSGKVLRTSLQLARYKTLIFDIDSILELLHYLLNSPSDCCISRRASILQMLGDCCRNVSIITFSLSWNFPLLPGEVG